MSISVGGEKYKREQSKQTEINNKKDRQTVKSILKLITVIYYLIFKTHKLASRTTELM